MYEDVDMDDGPSSKFQSMLTRKWQHYLDLSAPHIVPRWLLSGLVMLVYCLRVYLINGQPRPSYGLRLAALVTACGCRTHRSPACCHWHVH
jgi:hypothetical protein